MSASIPPDTSQAAQAAEFGFRTRCEGDGLVIELEFTPKPRLVPIVRRFVTEFYAELFDAEIVSRIALATHELMENAVKYSDGDMVSLTVSVTGPLNARDVLIRIANPTAPENSQRLARLLESIASAEDPLALYLEMMTETAEHEEGSGLGLVRIRVESEMELSHTIRGQWVEVSARTTWARGSSHVA